MASQQPIARSFEIQNILSRTFDTIGDRLGLFLGLSLLLIGIQGVLGNWWLSQLVSGDSLALLATFRSSEVWGPALLLTLISTAIAATHQVALTRATVKHLAGAAPGFAESLELGLMLLLPVAVLRLIIAVASGFGLLLLIVPGIMIWLVWSVAVPVYVEERIGLFEALQRSRELTRGARGGIFLIMLIMAIAFGVAGMIIDWIIGDRTSLVHAVARAALSSVSALVTITLLAVIYVELRNIKEGLSGGELEKVFD